MFENNAKEIDFVNVSPFLRFIHKDFGTSKDFYIPWRMIYDYEIIYVIEGCAIVKTETGEYLIEAGDIHVMRPFLKHSRHIPDGKKFIYYSIHCDLIYMGEENDFSPIEVYSKPCGLHCETAEVNEFLSHRPMLVLKDIQLPDKMKTVNSSAYIKILNNTLDSFSKKEFGYEIDTKIGLLSLMKLIICDMHIYNIDKNFSINSDKFASCLQYIYDNYNKDIDFHIFASSLGFAPNYFRKLFKQSTSKSPKEFIIDLRIEKAVELIIEGENNISEISRLVGYEDLHYFSKLFKLKKGCSPSTYIKNKQLPNY